MPRRNSAVKRDVLPDPLYNNKVVTKLVNQVMLDGKKGLAQSIVYGAFNIVQEKLGVEPIDAFTQALENVKPLLETKGRRVGGATYQVPMEIDLIVVKHLQSDGWYSLLEREIVKELWKKNLQAKSSMLTTIQVHL